MLKFFLIVMMGIFIEGCSSFSNSEILLKTNPDKRKQKPEYMPCDEKPIESKLHEKKSISIAPQLGIRIPLEK